MNPENLTRLMNSLLAAKIAAERIVESNDDLNIQRRYRIQREISLLIDEVEHWQSEAVKLSRGSVA